MLVKTSARMEGGSDPVRSLMWRRLEYAGVELDRPAQPLGEVHVRLVSELGAGARDVGQRMPDVAGARRRILHGQPSSADLADAPNQVVQRDALADGDVERLARGVRRGHGEEVGLHDVVDVREVARLFPVAED